MPEISPIIIRYATAGLGEVMAAFDTVEARMKRVEKATTQDGARASRGRVRTAEDETKAKERAYNKLVKDMDRQEKLATKAAEREAKQREKVTEATGKAAAREAKKASDAEIKEQERTTRAVEREEQRRMQLRIRASEAASRLAARAAQEEIREQERAAKTWSARGRSVGGSVVGSVGRVIGGIGAVAGATLGIGGGFALMDAGRKEFEAQKQAALFINQVTTGSKPPEGATLSKILANASQVSVETGMDKADVIAGTREYAKTARGGDFKGAMDNMRFFAQMSSVTGRDMGEIAGAAGLLQSQNASLAADPKKMRQMMLDVLAQTKSGSLGMGEFIQQAGTLGSMRGAFAGDETENQRKLFALGQIVAPRNPLEAGTFIKDFASEIYRGKHLGEAKAAGVSFTDGLISDPIQAIKAIFKSTGGDPGKINKIMGGDRGGAIFGELLPGYRGALKTGGKSGGDQFIEDTIGSIVNQRGSPEDFQKMFQQTMDTPGQKFELAMTKVTDELETALAPHLAKFADKLPDLIDKLGGVINAASHFATWFEDNPLKGIGLIVMGAVAKDLAAAGIGMAAKAAITAAIQAAGSIVTAATTGATATSGAIGAAGAAAPVASSAAALAGSAGMIAAAVAAPAIVAANMTPEQAKASAERLENKGNAADAQTGAAIAGWNALFKLIGDGFDKLKGKAADTNAAIDASNPKRNVPIQQRPVQ